MDGVKLSLEDAEAIGLAMEALTAAGEVGDADTEALEVAMIAALLSGHRDATVAVKTSIARLAAEVYLREERHLAPTASLRRPREPDPRPRITWPWHSPWMRTTAAALPPEPETEPKVQVHIGPQCPWKRTSWFGMLTEKEED